MVLNGDLEKAVESAAFQTLSKEQKLMFFMMWVKANDESRLFFFPGFCIQFGIYGAKTTGFDLDIRFNADIAALKKANMISGDGHEFKVISGVIRE